MTLLERISYFIEAAHSQEDAENEVEQIINRMTPYQLICELSDALEHAGVTFNTRF